MHAHVSNLPEDLVALFEPTGDQLKKRGLTIEEAATQPDNQQHITLIVRNNSLESVSLQEGKVLGCLQLVAPVPTSETVEQEYRTTLDGLVGSLHPTDLTVGDCSQDDNTYSERDRQLLDTIDWDAPEVSEDERQQLKGVLLKCADVFALTPTELFSTDYVYHNIDTGDSPPCRQQARRIPFALRMQVDGIVSDKLKQGVIQPSRSPWASPVVLVAKKDGTTGFCVDYHRLNSITKMDVFPLPRVDDSLDLLAKSKYFTTLGLSSGYWQVKLAPESIEKTALVTHAGLFEFVVMPFGLHNAPATFQRLMEAVLAGLTRDICMDYMDDILVMGATFEEHLQNLEQVFRRLREANLRLKPSKCRMAKK